MLSKLKTAASTITTLYVGIVATKGLTELANAWIDERKSRKNRK